ncbi:MAG: DUF924 family protein [Defluviicoccus sp.]|nr:DUF924 family protein [Defluviicoccus sp.]
MLDFWLGPLRSAADASRENWQQGMLKWRVGPFARSADYPNAVRTQRAWCEQIHREGLDSFFRDPVWNTPRGLLAKLIVLDQFPRTVYRGTALAYAYDPLAGSLSRQACEADREFANYNVIERFWIYAPLSHAEDLTLQELSIRKFARWSVDLTNEVPGNRRRINQFVSWSIVKAAIEHSETLLLFGRFPHRNAALMRPHRGGESRYLTDPMRPLWSFTQPLNPDYFALLGALHRVADGIDEDRIAREAVASLLRTAELTPEDPASPMDLFALAGDDAVPYPILYRHLRLPEQAQTFDRLRRAPPVVELTDAVRRLILKDGDSSWPPCSAKHSLEPAIDVAALSALVRGDGPSAATAGARPSGRDGLEPTSDPPPDSTRSLSLAIPNDASELERVADAVDGFADRHGLSQQDRFQVQLCIEEVLMYIVEHGYDDPGGQSIDVHLEMDDGGRRLAIRTVDDGRELDPKSFMFQPGPDTIMEETVEEGIGLHLVRTYADDLRYRHENGRNHLSLSKRIGS